MDVCRDCWQNIQKKTISIFHPYSYFLTFLSNGHPYIFHFILIDSQYNLLRISVLLNSKNNIINVYILLQLLEFFQNNVFSLTEGRNGSFIESTPVGRDACESVGSQPANRAKRSIPMERPQSPKRYILRSRAKRSV